MLLKHIKILRVSGEHWHNWRFSKNAIVTVAGTDADEDIFYDRNTNSLCNYYDGQLNRYFTTITCKQAMKGQFVQLLFNATTIINLYEIEVHGF